MSRPKGPTPKSAETRETIFRTALTLFAGQGYVETSLRQVAEAAGTSVGLTYRYFPSKVEILAAFYDELSTDFEARARALPRASWGRTFLALTRESFAVLTPHRRLFQALMPALLSAGPEGLFTRDEPSRWRVQGAFEAGIGRALDAPADAPALGRSLYMLHLAMILGWLLDRSHDQAATRSLFTLLERALPLGALILSLPGSHGLLLELDGLLRAAFLDRPGKEAP